MLGPFGVIGDKEKKRKEERRERKKKEKVKGKLEISLFLCLPREPPRETPRFSTFCKVISSEIMLQNSRFMCWDVKYIDSPVYFMKNVKAFVVLKLVFISVLNTVFYLKSFD